MWRLWADERVACFDSIDGNTACDCVRVYPFCATVVFKLSRITVPGSRSTGHSIDRLASAREESAPELTELEGRPSLGAFPRSANSSLSDSQNL